jgi:hypothetical protein
MGKTLQEQLIAAGLISSEVKAIDDKVKKEQKAQIKAQRKAEHKRRIAEERERRAQ